MVRVSTMLAALVILVMVNIIVGQTDPPPGGGSDISRQICITFNDLPADQAGDRIKRLMITDEILGVLDEFGVKAAGFVRGDLIGEDLDLLDRWLIAGHVLGNQTYSHPDLNDVPPTLFLHNLEKCQDILDSLTKNSVQKKRYFRYPYLHYGQTIPTREAVAGYLQKNNFIVAHVSVDVDDFAYNMQYEKIYESADSIEIVRLGGEYIDHVMGRLRDSEELSREILGRQIKQVLLLHANRLNSNFLADILAELQLDGYQFITLDQALDDPAYEIEDFYAGPKGLSFLERLARTDPDLMPAREK